MGIRVSGVGGYVPSKTMTNYELAMMVDTSDEWITEKTGIRERRIAAPEEAPSDMACQAALRCLTQAGVDKAAVDLVIVACATPDQSQPAVACMVQEKLGIAERQCPAFDVNSVCAGFVFALNVAQGMMLTDRRALPERAGHRHRRVLQDPELEGSHGPACSSATAQGRCCCRTPTPTIGASTFTWAATAGGASSSRCPAAAPACRSSAEVIEKRLNTFVMNGPRVWEFAINTVPRDDPFAARRTRPRRRAIWTC